MTMSPLSGGPRFGLFHEKQVNRFMAAGVFNHLKKESVVKIMGLYQQAEGLYETDSSLVGDIFTTAWKDVAKGVKKSLADRNKEYTAQLEATLKGPLPADSEQSRAAEALAMLYADPNYETPDDLFNHFMTAGQFEKAGK